jgi:hypothetical protein
MSTLEEIHGQKYCPVCGHPLDMSYDEDENCIDMEDEEALDKLWEQHHDPNFSEADELHCTNIKCDFHESHGPGFRFHHPFDYKKPAGDSWSISWIK